MTTPDENHLSDAKEPPKKLRIVLMVFIPVIFLVAGGVIYWQGGRFVETDNAYVKAEVIPISAEVSGSIIDVLAKENQPVSAGQVLFILKSEPFKLAVDEAQAHAAEVHAELSALKASYREMQANIELAEQNHQFAQKELQRQHDLKGKNFVSESTLDDLEHKVDVTRQQLQVLNLDLQRIEASLGGDVRAPLEQHPRYRNAIAKLQLNQLALSRIQVKAPVSGVVSQLPGIGQYVHTGNTVAALVSNEKLWVEANFSELDLTHVRVGQTVEIKIDTYPQNLWQGKVESISPATGAEFSILPPQNATGNWVKIAQRVPVRIELINKQNTPPLRSGLSAVVEIDTEYRRKTFLASASEQPSNSHTASVDSD